MSEDPAPIALCAMRVSPEAMEIRPAPVARSWISEGARFTRNCLPILLANQAGWELLNPVRFTAVWGGGDDREAIRVISSQPLQCVTSHFGYGVLTWNLPYLFRTSPGYNLLVRGPANLPKDGIQALEGLCETDWASATFTMNWRFTRIGVPVTFDAGEPFCLLVPQRRGELELVEPTIMEAPTDLEALYREWNDSRLEFNQKLKSAKESSHQLHYLRGRHIDGTAAPEHQTKLNLAPFASAEQ